MQLANFVHELLDSLTEKDAPHPEDTTKAFFSNLYCLEGSSSDVRMVGALSFKFNPDTLVSNLLLAEIALSALGTPGPADTYERGVFRGLCEHGTSSDRFPVFGSYQIDGNGRLYAVVVDRMGLAQLKGERKPDGLIFQKTYISLLMDVSKAPITHGFRLTKETRYPDWIGGYTQGDVHGSMCCRLCPTTAIPSPEQIMNFANKLPNSIRAKT